MVPPFLPDVLAEPLELLDELPHAASANAAPAATTAIKADLDSVLIKTSSSSGVGWCCCAKMFHKPALGEPVQAVPNGPATRRLRPASRPRGSCPPGQPTATG